MVMGLEKEHMFFVSDDRARCIGKLMAAIGPM
jgi:hypothetical protein